MNLFISAAWLAVVTWLILRAIKQRGLLPRVAIVPPPVGEQAPRIAIVVPARDEERSIERCVRSLLAQCAADFEVIVVDDGSTDATPAAAATLDRQVARVLDRGACRGARQRLAVLC